MNKQLIARRTRAEQSVLGGLLLDNTRWVEVQALLSVSDFHHIQHQLIFVAIKKQLTLNQPADVVTISDTYGIDLSYIGLLAKDTPSAANIMAYAHIVKNEAERHKAVESLTLALESINQGNEPAEVLQHIIEQAEKATIHKQGGTMFKHIKEVTVKPIDWLIDDFIESHALVEVFGAPESGKSLLAIDWGLSIAAGIPWRGHKTQQGSVFYIAGEGHNGLSRRFSAWSVNNGVSTDNLPFYQSSGAVGLYNIDSAMDPNAPLKPP